MSDNQANSTDLTTASDAADDALASMSPETAERMSFALEKIADLVLEPGTDLDAPWPGREEVIDKVVRKYTPAREEGLPAPEPFPRDAAAEIVRLAHIKLLALAAGKGRSSKDALRVLAMERLKMIRRIVLRCMESSKEVTYKWEKVDEQKGDSRDPNHRPKMVRLPFKEKEIPPDFGAVAGHLVAIELAMAKLQGLEDGPDGGKLDAVGAILAELRRSADGQETTTVQAAAAVGFGQLNPAGQQKMFEALAEFQRRSQQPAKRIASREVKADDDDDDGGEE
jgi:hypothetical protein